MGEYSKRLRSRIRKRVSVDEIDINDAYKKLNADGTMLHIIGAGRVGPAMMKPDALTSQTREAFLFRRVFMVWDRIRTGEYGPWECGLCAKKYTGLSELSVFAVIESIRGEISRTKPLIASPICGACDRVSTEETKRQIAKRFGFPETQQSGHA
jgi:hypothetical protein